MKFFIRIGQFGLFISLFVCPDMKAVLDGLAAPIHLTTKYTFSNYEWARGNVYFYNGFDVPPGGTVFLGIAPGFVNGNVNLKGGTLLLQQETHFLAGGDITGTGFIGLNNNVLAYDNPLGFLASASFIKIISGGTFRGLHTARLNLRNWFDLTSVSDPVRFRGGTLITGTGIKTAVSNPSFLGFDAVTIVNQSVTFLNPIVELRGQTILDSPGIFSARELRIANSVIVINSGSRIQASLLNLVFFDSTLLVRNSKLDFVSTGTGSIELGAPYPVQGRILFEGESSIESSTGNELRINAGLDFEFLSGSRLVISPGTHLTIE